jgi:hypothetical protein
MDLTKTVGNTGSGPFWEPTGTIEDDPHLTDKKFPGNPTRSYRTRQPLRVVSEVFDWEGRSGGQPGSTRTSSSTQDAGGP